MLRYQPHIDGLRAVAVLLVILHHLGDWAGMGGGYVGVDVFFVISGYLITSVVKAEIEQCTFTIGGFYKRRVIRLAPAYFLVLVATTVAALVWMLPAELAEYSRSAAASSVFLANFFMWREVGGYFGVSADTVPLLHLWSLAVEEQYYLFWPFFLLVVTRLLKRRVMPYLLVALVIGGVAVSEWGVQKYPAAAYYLLPTRFYELMVGSLLAYLPAVAARAAVSNVLAGAGAMLVLYAGFTFNRETPFPGLAALVPVLGTALLIRCGEGTWVGRLLSTRPATQMGLISYPAYLWHWPILVFLGLNQIEVTRDVGLAVLVSTFVLSWLTWKFVELPARAFRNRSPRRVVVLGAGLPVFAVCLAAWMLVAANGLPARFPESLNKKSEALLAHPNRLRGRCNEGPPTSPLPPDKCILGRAGGPVDFLLVGDSHANHFTGFLDELGKDANLRGYDMTRSNTPFLPGVDRWHMRNGAEEHHEAFVPRNRYVSSLLASNHYRVVVLAGNYTGFADGEIIRAGDLTGEKALASGLRNAILEAKASAEKVVIITTIPLLTAGLSDCSLRSERFDTELDCTLDRRHHEERAAAAGRIIESMRREFTDVVWVEPEVLMCSENLCETELDGVPLYKDQGHLNDYGSRLLARRLLSRCGNPLNRVNSIGFLCGDK
ncbi:acyltransferase family protein [Arenimonas caeni]|nr:acyltransferase family protein [Arenimonas caeni]